MVQDSVACGGSIPAASSMMAGLMRFDNCLFMMRKAAHGLGAARYSSRAVSSCPSCSHASPTASIMRCLSEASGTKLLSAPACMLFHEFCVPKVLAAMTALMLGCDAGATVWAAAVQFSSSPVSFLVLKAHGKPLAMCRK